MIPYLITLPVICIAIYYVSDQFKNKPIIKYGLYFVIFIINFILIWNIFNN